MIHRKWSLLNCPVAIFGGIVASLVVTNFIFVKEDPFRKACQKKRADQLQQALERNIILDEVLFLRRLLLIQRQTWNWVSRLCAHGRENDENDWI